ncbi:MAG: glutathione S-transferase [Hyphomonas sp.]|uniref:glutathione S-transferase n=1 Tax=Hyphomonas sp. TaxID=87 RepID=UPI0035296FB8
MTATPILYSFRRCPYAMRARLGMSAARQTVRIREVVLRDKPAEMLAASPKGTVPVLVLDGGEVIDESLDIMHWALGQNDPEGWLAPDAAGMDALIQRNDGPFKRALDRYKYPDRYAADGIDRETWRAEGMAILDDLSGRIAGNGGQLMGPQVSLADMAIFPFVRQFAATDAGFWDETAPAPLKAWLSGHLESPRFRAIMAKYAPWAPGVPEPELPIGA